MIILKHANDPDSKFDPKQLEIGTITELEHTKSKKIAKAIAKAHLSEIPDYYTRLSKMEKVAKRKRGNK